MGFKAKETPLTSTIIQFFLPDTVYTVACEVIRPIWYMYSKLRHRLQTAPDLSTSRPTNLLAGYDHPGLDEVGKEDRNVFALRYPILQVPQRQLSRRRAPVARVHAGG